MITKLIKKARKNPKFLEELKAKEEAQDQKKKEAMDKIGDMIANNTIIDSAHQVTNELNHNL